MLPADICVSVTRVREIHFSPTPGARPQENCLKSNSLTSRRRYMIQKNVHFLFETKLVKFADKFRVGDLWVANCNSAYLGGVRKKR